MTGNDSIYIYGWVLMFVSQFATVYKARDLETDEIVAVKKVSLVNWNTLMIDRFVDKIRI